MTIIAVIVGAFAIATAIFSLSRAVNRLVPDAGSGGVHSTQKSENSP